VGGQRDPPQLLLDFTASLPLSNMSKFISASTSAPLALLAEEDANMESISTASIRSKRARTATLSGVSQSPLKQMVVEEKKAKGKKSRRSIATVLEASIVEVEASDEDSTRRWYWISDVGLGCIA
jgi:hypothetical protein